VTAGQAQRNVGLPVKSANSAKLGGHVNAEVPRRTCRPLDVAAVVVESLRQTFVLDGLRVFGGNRKLAVG